MTRREAVFKVSFLVGGIITGADAFLISYKLSLSKTLFSFNNKDLTLLNEIADTILPPTSTPGDKDANVFFFIVIMVKDCYQDQEVFADGHVKMEEAANKN